MKKMLRMSVLSVLVLAALAFSAFSAMAMPSASGTETAAASAAVTSSLKQEVIGTVTAINATSITLNGTVYTLSASTHIQGVVQTGDTVKLEIVTNPDGSVTVYEVAKPNSPGSSIDVSGTEPASIDPISTEAASLDKSNVVVPTSTVEPVHTEISSPDKPEAVELISTVKPIHTEAASPDKGSSTGSSLDKNNTASTLDKSGSSLDKNSNNAGNASGHDTNNDSLQP